jgi:hypothetical protein
LWSQKTGFDKLFLRADPRIRDISWTPHVIDYDIEWISYLMESRMAELYYVCNTRMMMYASMAFPLSAWAPDDIIEIEFRCVD